MKTATRIPAVCYEDVGTGVVRFLDPLTNVEVMAYPIMSVLCGDVDPEPRGPVPVGCLPQGTVFLMDGKLRRVLPAQPHPRYRSSEQPQVAV